MYDVIVLQANIRLYGSNSCYIEMYMEIIVWGLNIRIYGIPYTVTGGIKHRGS
jgi:hypothetical protein